MTAGRPRIAFLSYSTGEFDARTERMAATALAAGFEVAVYARWEPGLAIEEPRDGYRLRRVPVEPGRGIPGGRAAAALVRRLRRRRASASPVSANAASTSPASPDPRRGGLAGRVRDDIRALSIFPVRPLAWAAALERVAEPADVWHGMWAGTLPALARLRDRHGGATVYDSRDVYLRSRGFDRLGRPERRLLRAIERRWARRADAVVTVNDAYADLLARDLRIERPIVVMNTPPRTTPPAVPPDRLRGRLSLAPSTRVVLYQGGLLPERGIEEAMDAILEVPDAVLVLLGYGPLRDRLAMAAADPPYAGRVHLLDAVPPSELLDWTASADAMVMAIRPTTENHRQTTPQKLFEAIAVGVPVVATDLPGMAAIVRETGAGVLVDPDDPGALAAGLRQVLDEPAAARADRRERTLRAAHDRYAWEVQSAALLDLYRRLLDRRGGRG